MENKIKQILHRMIEKRHKEYSKEVFKISLLDTIRTQVHHGRLDPDSVPAMEQYVEIIMKKNDWKVFPASVCRIDGVIIAG